MSRGVGFIIGVALVLWGCASYKGPTAFLGGFELGGLESIHSGASVSICITAFPCMSFTRPKEAAEADFYPIFSERGGYALPHWDGAPVVVDVTVAGSDGSVLLHGRTKANVELYRPSGCFGYGPVIAVAFDETGVLHRVSIRGLGPRCEFGPTTPTKT